MPYPMNNSVGTLTSSAATIVTAGTNSQMAVNLYNSGTASTVATLYIRQSGGGADIPIWNVTLAPGDTTIWPPYSTWNMGPSDVIKGKDTYGVAVAWVVGSIQ